MSAASMNYSVELTSGVTVTYWRVTGMQINFTSGAADVTLSAWLNESAFNGGLKPVTSRVVTVTPSSDVIATINTSLSSLVPQALGV